MVCLKNAIKSTRKYQHRSADRSSAEDPPHPARSVVVALPARSLATSFSAKPTTYTERVLGRKHRQKMVIASSPEVPGPEAPKVVSFPSTDVPVQAVTVFCKNKAEITRVANFSSPSGLGRHEVSIEIIRALILGSAGQIVLIKRLQ